MGKAADNERIKLRATFFNNISVAFTVTGLFVPYVALLTSGDKLADSIDKAFTFSLTPTEIAASLTWVVVLIGSGFMAWKARRDSDKIAKGIQD